MMDLEILRVDPKKKTGKQPVVFIHGMWHGAWCWEDNFMRRFADAGYPCIALSLPGHGSSPGPRRINSLRIRDYVEALRTVIDSLDALPILVGHSMGGRIIQKYLDTSPCAAAILVCPVPSSGLVRISMKMIFTTKYTLPALLRLDLSGIVDSDEKARSLFLNQDENPATVAECGKKLGKESMLAFIDMLAPSSPKRHCRKTPMLVLSGGKDALFTMKEGESTARKYGAEHVVFESLPHDMMLDKDFHLAADYAINWLEGKALGDR